MERVVIAFEFSADLDRVPGWGYTPEDWVALVESQLNHNKHYNTELKIISVTRRNNSPTDGHNTK